MSAGHQHVAVSQNSEQSLLLALAVTGIFFVIELLGGILNGSLSLISDAAHMFTDITALAISWGAIKIGQRSADSSRTFGYYRFEILAAVFNTLFLFCVALYIVYQAYQRLSHPAEIHSLSMMIIAILGLIVNLIAMRLLDAEKDHNLNIKSAYLEVWNDMLGSVGVLLAAVIIYFTQWQAVDSMIAVLIGLWILPRTYLLLKESINILLEGVPKEIDLQKLQQAMCQTAGVRDLHELHVWAISSNKISLTAHVVLELDYEQDAVMSALRQLLSREFHITHTTLQLERNPCMDSGGMCHFQKSMGSDSIDSPQINRV